MKKIYFLPVLFCAVACIGAGCKKQPDYLSYVSEKRSNIYMYSSDGLEIKIYVGERETPYSTDGIKGEVSQFSEVFVTLPENPDSVEIEVGSLFGEMNYRAVENAYYLSCADVGITGDSAEVKLVYGGKEHEFCAVSVIYDGVISCEDAVKCVIEHAHDSFLSMTDGDIFAGEIFVRLLYDEGCYYYVGVCGRDKKITAYLVDGERGKVIATKELQG